MRKCCVQAFDDGMAIGLGLDCKPGLGSDAFYSFDETCKVHRIGRDGGRVEGALWMAAYIAIGTWAANIEIERWKTRKRNAYEAPLSNCPECGVGRIGTTRKCATCTRYYYGHGEYDDSKLPECPTCDTWRR